MCNVIFWITRIWKKPYCIIAKCKPFKNVKLVLHIWALQDDTIANTFQLKLVGLKTDVNIETWFKLLLFIKLFSEVYNWRMDKLWRDYFWKLHLKQSYQTTAFDSESLKDELTPNFDFWACCQSWAWKILKQSYQTSRLHTVEKPYENCPAKLQISSKMPRLQPWQLEKQKSSWIFRQITATPKCQVRGTWNISLYTGEKPYACKITYLKTV